MRLKVFTALAVAVLMVGCLAVHPGADPLVVRAEQTETMALATFDLVLRINQVNRSFWATNTPGFAVFCNWLRVQTPYQGTNVSRATKMMFDLADLKTFYKGAKTTTSSNALFTAILTLDLAVRQASAWQTIVTAPVVIPDHVPEPLPY